ncbi:mitochondrial fission ELM1 family protein [Stappia indica]|uniref:Nucleoside-diphosphate sugar epimerase n=1 Tax=Stappia indica TaxID=538381 RepID=A0A857C5Y0_9HYPH|nr:mitochondrial fission ELM1 family protein [Stappia indica]QGZ34324.1 nucleoside-diphosphate sugar epimerase [Stappia indica]
MTKKYPESETSQEPATAWVLTDGKAGDETQCLAVAEALGLAAECRRVAPRAPWSWIMPRLGLIDPREAPSRPGSPTAPPFPDLVIASGRRAVSYLARIKRESFGRTFTVFLKDPRTGAGAADLIWVPEHDTLRGDNVIATPSGPHRFSQDRLAAARAAPRPEIAALPRPRVAVLVGGDSRNHRFSDGDMAELAQGLARIAAEGAALMVTASRRTPPALARALRKLAASGPHIMWDGSGDNPMLDYLANADAVVVTADSANMVGEALASGRAVHVFHPSGGHRKFDAFLGAVSARNAVHPFPGPLKVTTCEPIDSTPVIAEAIRQRLAAHRARLAQAATGERT